MGKTILKIWFSIRHNIFVEYVKEDDIRLSHVFQFVEIDEENVGIEKVFIDEGKNLFCQFVKIETILLTF